MGSQFGLTLPSTATDSQQQAITEWLSDDTRHTTHVSEGIHEQHQLHLRCVDCVIVF